MSTHYDRLPDSGNTRAHAVMDNTTAWRLEVDGGRCDRHGICAVCCPERIELDEWGFAIVSRETISEASTLRRARQSSRRVSSGRAVLTGDRRRSIGRKTLNDVSLMRRVQEGRLDGWRMGA